MHVVSDVVRSVIALDDAFVALYVLTAIAAAEVAIIPNLAERVGGIRKLLKMASSPTKKQINDAINKKTDA